MIPEKITSNWLTMAVMSNTKCIFKDTDHMVEWLYNNIDHFRKNVRYDRGSGIIHINDFPIEIGVHNYYDSSKNHTFYISHYNPVKLTSILLKLSDNPGDDLIIDSSEYFPKEPEEPNNAE